MASDPLASPPPCPMCGAPIVEGHHPAEPPDEDGLGAEPECWSYHCTSAECRWECGIGGEIRAPLTMRTAPWTAPVVAAVLAVVDAELTVWGRLRSTQAGLLQVRALLAGVARD